MSNSLKVLIVSDLHAVIDERHKDDSHLFIDGASSEFVDAFISFVNDLGVNFDLLVCAGDVANKASNGAFEAGWMVLNKIRKELGVRDFYCVPGNHDHKSRHTGNSFDPKHDLQFANPPFPLDCNIKSTHFWAWNWCCVNCDSYNMVLLNSSAYHGYGDEHSHGRVAYEISDQIKDYVNSERFIKKPINILLCHHHPTKMEQVDRDYDTQEMQGGQYLIQCLGEAGKGGWLIIHGHKHFPEISYASGSTSEPITVLSAGSFSAVIHSEIMGKTSNQFYILDIDLSESKASGRAVGKFETYEWTLKKGWSRSESESLPAKGGFGSLLTPSLIASRIESLIEEDEAGFLEENDLTDIQKIVDNFVPTDFKKLVNNLRSLGFDVIYDSGKINQVGRGHG
ncbi:metallophosphoesterase [Halomonas sp. McH1-25]|uniref:metallophosphoesterase family protein n=1 Tax=unclassified Halomonas TaxID=2609666 RepID=UPI001EF3E85A|nr:MULTISPECIES: metallophosphoesterase [unclassified Halomonas]MCG7598784.1 metallophosphoesterase [Halomonas sp. McH1-25]MCP1340747.1 metallophosphoesterase [Halomonas sp. FL8]MCP1359518.1 metallophosphoesterase [Halomonas sp. BBD45]MCP1363868.1 metallophosphoesterase [Halomonas sp. BBD48]